VFGATAPLGREVTIESLTANEVTLRMGKSVWVARLERLSADHLRLSTARGFVELERQR